jgi:cobalt-zinc-cadmium efflux system membrane fusion protein
MMRMILMIFVCLAFACSKQDRAAPEAADTKSATPEPDHVDEPEHEELPTRVRLTQNVIQDAKIETTSVTRETLPITLALPGEIVADPDKSARLSSPIPGRIRDVRFQEGSIVTRGSVLAIIAVPDLGKLRADQAAAQAKSKAARANAKRLNELLNQRLTSEQTYLDALAGAQALENEERAATEQLSALGLTGDRANPSSLALRAPISGVVVARNAVVGQPVNADETLCEIVDLSEVWFLGRVFEKDLGRLKTNAPAEAQLNAYPKERFTGRVEYIGKQVDPVARTVTARVRLTNRDDLLRLGLFGTAYVSTGENEHSEAQLVIPRNALTEVADKQVVFVQQPDNDFELHEVVLGAAALGKVQVLSGLREGEKVVTQGVFTLKSAVLKTTFAEEEE